MATAMNSDSAIQNFHRSIISAATAKLGRELSSNENRFITSRGGFLALEMIFDTVQNDPKERVEEYLNSENPN
jgi:hypothetical protein